MKNINSVYTTLDTILDTRTPILALLGEDKNYLNSKEYTQRTNNRFPTITSKVFDIAYKNRVKELLAISKPTPIIDEINNFHDTLLIEEASLINASEGDRDTYLYINIYPYDLSESEKEKLLKSILPYFINFEEIYLIDKEAYPSPEFLSSMRAIFDYGGLAYLDYQSDREAFNKANFLEVYFFIPKLIPTEDTFTDEDFHNLAEVLKPFIGLDYMPVEYFITKR